MNKTARKPEWDFVKGILIIFVVWGHVCSYVSGIYDKNLLTAVIRLYQMPMFILVSGYFQKGGAAVRRNLKIGCSRHLQLLSSRMLLGCSSLRARIASLYFCLRETR